MNNASTLTDTSASESEDDRVKVKRNPLQSSWKRKRLSTDDTEDEDIPHSINIQHFNSADSTAKKQSNEGKRSGSPSAKKFKTEYPIFRKGQSTHDYLEQLHEPNNNVKRISEGSDCEMYNPSKKYVEYLHFKASSAEDTEDEASPGISSQKCQKLTDSESDDRSSMEKTIPSNAPNMPVFNGMYTVGEKMMNSMGYKSGTGLGKFEQGRVDIVELSTQRGRQGLGSIRKEIEPTVKKWLPGSEQISVEEEVHWIPDCDNEVLLISDMREWIVEGNKKLTLDDETEFCDPIVLKEVLEYKTAFNNFTAEQLRNARTRSNPFEAIRSGIFLNRAAMKMANIDAVLDFMFTSPKKRDGSSAVSPKELLYFADVCAGPGGFSEYVLWRKKTDGNGFAKGFGFTLKDNNDFKLEDFFAGPPEMFEPYYGVADDGDIFKPENLRSLQKFVYINTDNKGVHFMMADGGFSVEGRENIQEILSKRLYLCQFLAALLLLRIDGHFVCKLFDIFTPFSVGLIYLMYNAFESVSIFKPNTSRPANSERYIICKWLKESSRDIRDYMFEINCILDKYSSPTSDLDVVEIVPLHILKNDEKFCNYISNSNNVLGIRQVVHLDKMRVYAKETNFHEEKQSDLRKQCLDAWKVPDQVRVAPSRNEPDKKCKQLMKEDIHYLTKQPNLLTLETLHRLDSVLEYFCIICGDPAPEEPPGLFISLGKSNIYRYDIKNGKWSKLDLILELPADTLVYGELISELKGEGRGQRKIKCLHIIDAIWLAGKDVKNIHYEDRMLMAGTLAKAVSKPTKTNVTPLRAKRVFELRKIEQVMNCLTMKQTKSSPLPRLCFDLQDGHHILPTGLMIFKPLIDPWVTAFSKGHRVNYYFHTKKNISKFERLPEACADFKTCFERSLLWKWEKGVQLIAEQVMERNKNAIHGDVFMKFVMQHVHAITHGIKYHE